MARTKKTLQEETKEVKLPPLKLPPGGKTNKYIVFDIGYFYGKLYINDNSLAYELSIVSKFEDIKYAASGNLEEVQEVQAKVEEQR